jgi:hypothetical protein
VDLSQDTTRYRFKARKGVEIKVTPLILPAISDFEADMERNVSIEVLTSACLLLPFFTATWARIVYRRHDGKLFGRYDINEIFTILHSV